MTARDPDPDPVADLADALDAAGCSDPQAAAESLLELLAMLKPTPPAAVVLGSRKRQPERAAAWHAR